MKLRQIIKTGGKTPREFTYTPNGRFVFVCNQDSSDITVLRKNNESELFEETGMRYEIPKPVCLIWR